MVVVNDIDIARQAAKKPIEEIAAKMGVDREDFEQFGRHKAKISTGIADRLASKPDGRLVLVTSINPTPAGEGKTTTSVGLTDALSMLGRRTAVALREPSIGPVFGIKGGAAGGGYAQVVPMEDINLHFTGDIHAVTSAHNLLAALIDNHLHQDNQLNLSSRKILFRRVMDLNDRSLRSIVNGLGGSKNGIPRESGFDISAASEVMAILCLSDDLNDLKKRISKIVAGYTDKNRPVTAEELEAQGAMSVLLKDAIKPNLVQTLENNPAFVHGGPFANIAHGCSSLAATKIALKLNDYVVTEAGFGADMGAEKFFNLKCRFGGLRPDAAVIVVSVRALKAHGGVARDRLGTENTDAVKKGLANLRRHVKIIHKFGVPAVIAVNRFPEDTERELDILIERGEELGCRVGLSEVWSKGGEGGIELAESLLKTIEEKPSKFEYLYDSKASLRDKIQTVAREVYGADGVDYSKSAEDSLALYEKLGYGDLPVCIAKTQYSLSDSPDKLGSPENFRIHIKDAGLSAGAGFVVPITEEVLAMPGLPKRPAAADIDIDTGGNITGLF